MHAGAGAVSQPVQVDDIAVVALSLSPAQQGDAAAGIQILSLTTGEPVEKLAPKGLELSTDSGAALRLDFVALGRSTSDYRSCSCPVLSLDLCDWQLSSS